MMRLIAAMDRSRGIATAEGIPWTLPTDQRFFVDTTRDGVILMGYGTYVEFDSPMHGRTNYVATSRTEPLADGFVAVDDPVAFARDHSGETIQNIGGAGLFASTIVLADELVLTRIEGDFRCTRFFPPFQDDFVRVTQSAVTHENGVDFTFETWHPHPGR